MEVVRLRLSLLLVLAFLLVSAAAASAAAWSIVPLPRHSGLSAISCRSTRWCEAIGSWQNRLRVSHWNGARWSVSSALPDPREASMLGITCRSTRACVAVGELFRREYQPRRSLIERWDGRRWHVESTPKPAAPKGYRGVNTSFRAVACPGAELCFAVGQAVPLGAGNAPGVPLIERWDGRRWHLVHGPAAGAPLTSISCISTRSCSAVGGVEHVVGTSAANNQQVEYPTTVQRWNGSAWSLGSFRPPAGVDGAGLLGVSCASAHRCLAVGNQETTVTDGGIAYQGVDQAIAGSGDGSVFTASPLAFPGSVYRGGTGSATPPATVLTSIACAPSNANSCAAVGGYRADNAAIGPLVASWNGWSWTQVPLRRGPVQLTSVSCPALGWCMAVGGGIAERYVG